MTKEKRFENYIETQRLMYLGKTEVSKISLDEYCLLHEEFFGGNNVLKTIDWVNQEGNPIFLAFLNKMFTWQQPEPKEVLEGTLKELDLTKMKFKTNELKNKYLLGKCLQKYPYNEPKELENYINNI